MGFPTEFGGGGDIGASVAAFETLAFGDLSVLVKVGVQFGLFGGAILQLGTKPHHDAYLADLVTGKVMGCFAMTETGHGSNVQALGTTATYDAATQEFVITTPDDASRKDYIGNAAAHAELAVVFAQLEIGGEGRGVHAFVVPVREDGRSCPGSGSRTAAARWGSTASTTAASGSTGCGSRGPTCSTSSPTSPRRVTTRARSRTPTSASSRCSAPSSRGASASAVPASTPRRSRSPSRRDMPCSAASSRPPTRDEEQLILDYGMHQRRLFPLIARTYALHFAQEYVAGALHDVFSGVTEDEQSRRKLESRAAGTKALGTWHATRTIQECREACGGAGYLSENRFAALKADTDVFTTFEGDNHVLLQLVAKGLLTDYSSEFEDMDQFGMVRFVAGLAVETVIERTSAHKLFQRIKDALPGGDQWDQEAGLLDPNYQRAMLRFREEHMLGGVARRLKRGIDDGMNPGEVFSRVQDHVIAAARAHVERMVLDSFIVKTRGAARRRPEGRPQPALRPARALTTIEADRAWFMEHGRLSSARSKAISREINDLCRKIRPLAVDLVDAFGVPEEMLRSQEILS